MPLTSPFMGIALAEADYATRLVSDDEDADDGVGEEASHGKMEEVPGVEAFKLPVKKGTEDLMFSRRTRADAGIGEKRAWAISPGKRLMSFIWTLGLSCFSHCATIGMGHIG